MRRSLALITVLVTASSAFCQPIAEPGPFLKEIRTHFAAWDRGHDGTLSFDDIELACADPAVKGPAAVAAATMRNVAKLRNLTLPQYAEALTQIDAGETANDYERGFAKTLERLQGMNRELFPAGLPKGEQLAQGKLGDCFLLAGVGTMAQTQPERLKALIEPLPGDKFALNFQDGKRVELPLPTDAEVLIGASTRGDGVWANAFEKAIGQRYLDKQPAEKRAVTPFAYIGKGGTPNTPMAMLIGKKIKREGCEMFQKPGLDDAGKTTRLDEIRNALDSAFKKHCLVIGGTGPITKRLVTDTEKDKGSITVPGLFYNHSYGVLAYDRATDVVTFWNPMSNAHTPKGPPGLQFGYPTRYGRFDCPLKEAVMWFGSFSIEQTEKLDSATNAE